MAPSVQVNGPPADAISAPTKAQLAESSVIQVPCANPSLQTTTDHKIKVVEAPVYAPRKGEVLLQIKATGICG